jgi:hypothetical protein
VGKLHIPVIRAAGVDVCKVDSVGYAFGRVKKKVEPFPCSDSTQMRPPARPYWPGRLRDLNDCGRAGE